MREAAMHKIGLTNSLSNWYEFKINFIRYLILFGIQFIKKISHIGFNKLPMRPMSSCFFVRDRGAARVRGGLECGFIFYYFIYPIY
jgi:hypothetical protein